jgi:HK97 family phage prohead protease
MAKKIFTAPLELKADGKEGEFRAVFSTLNVVDLDGDVTTPGAFEGQETVVEPWNHGWTLPAGKGEIKSDEKKAWIEGEFFLDTEVGKENYQTVKNLGPLAEWSYTFDIVEVGFGKFNDRDVRFLKKLDVIGVSPVTRGAGIDTRTTAIKSNQADENGGEASPPPAPPEGRGEDGKPGVGPAVVLAEIELIELEI